MEILNKNKPVGVWLISLIFIAWNGYGLLASLFSLESILAYPNKFLLAFSFFISILFLIFGIQLFKLKANCLTYFLSASGLIFLALLLKILLNGQSYFSSGIILIHLASTILISVLIFSGVTFYITRLIKNKTLT